MDNKDTPNKGITKQYIIHFISIYTKWQQWSAQVIVGRKDTKAYEYTQEILIGCWNVTISAIKPRVHIYPSSPMPDSCDMTMNDTSTTSASFLYDQEDVDETSDPRAESFYASALPPTPGPITRTRKLTQRVRDVLSYPIEKHINYCPGIGFESVGVVLFFCKIKIFE
eukprot:gene4394-5142_t